MYMFLHRTIPSTLSIFTINNLRALAIALCPPCGTAIDFLPYLVLRTSKSFQHNMGFSGDSIFTEKLVKPFQQFSDSLSPNGFINKFCKHSVKNNLLWWIVHWKGCLRFQYTGNPGPFADDNSMCVISTHYSHFIHSYCVLWVCTSKFLSVNVSFFFSHFCYVSWFQTSIQNTRTSWIHVWCLHFQNWNTATF